MDKWEEVKHVLRKNARNQITSSDANIREKRKKTKKKSSLFEFIHPFRLEQELFCGKMGR